VTNIHTEVVIIGGGTAGIAAGHRLRAASIECLIVEARSRLGGRAWTVADPSGFAHDLGCGWLHSANRNPWVDIATAQGRVFDKAPPPWTRPSPANIFPLSEQAEFRQAMQDFFVRIGDIVIDGHDAPASSALPAQGRWNELLTAVGTYISGAEFDRMSALDFDRYEDSEVNWRVADGYGAVIATYGEGLPVILGCPVRHVDHTGGRLKIETAKGAITADQAIVTLPTTVLAEQERFFVPTLPEKIHAANNLPLGLADKLFLSLEHAEEFEQDSRFFGCTDRSATGNYHLRPFGRPTIEAYFAGQLAHDLEVEGENAFFDFAVTELVRQFGSKFAHRVRPIHIHRWGADPFARGSYSYAVPGAADDRAILAAAVDERLFFAGEACSRHDFSTAHGGFITGVTAADQVIAARQCKPSA